MKHQSLSPLTPSLPFTIFIFFIKTSTISSGGSKYEACVPQNCGNQTVRYPFWIKNKQEPFCGYPGFELNCQNNNYPILQTPNNNYTIQEILYRWQTLRLCNTAVWNLKHDCWPPISNVSLEVDKFSVVSNGSDLYLLSNCSSLGENLLEYRIGCGEESRNGNGGLAMFGNDGNLGYGLQSCQTEVLAPVELVSGDVIRDYLSVLRRGFLVKWRAPNCSGCEESGGRCGLDLDTYLFKCFCTDRPHADQCPSGRSRLPLILGTELGPISKTQNTQARQSACEELLAQAVRHAPTLLNYEPSYKGVLKKKEKKKKEDGEPVEKGKRKRGSKQAAEASRTRKKVASPPEGVQPKRTRGVKLPKIGYTAAEWLTPLCAEPSIEDMSRRNIQRPPIPTKPLNPARRQTPAEQQQGEKKQKTSHDLTSPSVSKLIQIVDSATDSIEKELLVNPHIDLAERQVEAATLRPFSPSYTLPDGRILLLKDSVKEEPNLAVTLLRGLALPRNCDQVPSDLLPNLAEMCSHLVQAGQAALKAYDKAEKVQAERERFRSDRESYKAKWRASEKEVKEAEGEVENLKKELAVAKAATAAVVEQMKVEEKEKLRQADLKGYEAGIRRASQEYTRIAYKMVNEALEGRLPDFYRRGYAEGANQMAGVMIIQAEPGFLRQLSDPVVPDLELPYTEEDCAPLPPEEDDDDDAEMAEASQKEDAAVAEDLEQPTEADGQKEVAAVENP